MSSRILLAAWNILVVVGCRRGREYSTDAAYLPACIDLTLAHVYGGYEDVRGQIVCKRSMQNLLIRLDHLP